MGDSSLSEEAHLDSQSTLYPNEGQGDEPGGPDVDPQPLRHSTPRNVRDSGQQSRHDASTITDLCSDLPELEIVSLLSEGQPKYTLRADTVFGYDNDDWLQTPLVPPEVVLGLTYEQIEETFKYFYSVETPRLASSQTPPLASPGESPRCALTSRQTWSLQCVLGLLLVGHAWNSF
ncbi:hypothetical protein AMECASPLE_024440 [Ameca splendens]|uniref:HAP1 N-terminal domain-containing protein n=1 Tax=Ameca splendens TaxID=208324 RepID=A0ABV0YFG3_9TELE